MALLVLAEPPFIHPFAGRGAFKHILEDYNIILRPKATQNSVHNFKNWKEVTLGNRIYPS